MPPRMMNRTMLKYPMTNPARAMPAPFKPPMLRLMALRAMCPETIAGIPASTDRIVMERMPRTRLVTALGSVLAAGNAAGGVELDISNYYGTPDTKAQRVCCGLFIFG